MSGKQPNGQTGATKDDSGTNSQRLRMEGNKDGVRNFGNQRRMISELERINALNLEPSLPKQDDGQRNVSRLNQNREALKGEFQNFLKTLQTQDKDKEKSRPPSNTTAPSFDPQQSRGGGTGSNNMAALKQTPAPTQGGGGPGNPQFLVNKSSTSESKSLGNILDAMLQQAGTTAPDTVGPDWPEAQGPSFHGVLGEPGQMKPPTNQLPQHDQHQQQQMPNQQQRSHNSNHGNQQQRPQGPPDQVQQQVRPMGPPGAQQQPGMPPQGYMVAQGPPGQGGQQMMFQMPGQGGPGNMMPIQGMPMQGQNVMMMAGQPGMQMMNPQMMNMQGMMVAPGQQGGQMPQGGMMGVPQMGGHDQQQQQMMFVPMMMPTDQAYAMNPQGYPGQPQGGPGNQPQAPYMMPQQGMFHQQGPQN